MDTKSEIKIKMTPFEEKLLSRVANAHARLQKDEPIKEIEAKLTIRRIKLELAPRPVNAEEVKAIRKQFGVSQAVFASFLQVHSRTVQHWEQGRKKVTGTASRILAEMILHPEYWNQRFRELAKSTNA